MARSTHTLFLDDPVAKFPNHFTEFLRMIVDGTVAAVKSRPFICNRGGGNWQPIVLCKALASSSVPVRILRIDIVLASAVMAVILLWFHAICTLQALVRLGNSSFTRPNVVPIAR